MTETITTPSFLTLSPSSTVSVALGRLHPHPLVDAHLEGTFAVFTPGSIFVAHPTTIRSARNTIRSSKQTSTKGGITKTASIEAWIEKEVNMFRPLFDHLDRIDRAVATWTRAETVPPNQVAIDNARALLDRLRARHVRPDRVFPSAEGGIALTFQAGRRYADFECANTGSITRVFSNGAGNVTARAVDRSFTGQNIAISELLLFLDY